jgi:hypothetical protein
MYIMLSNAYGVGHPVLLSYLIVSVASQGYWHPASILEPNLALALNNLARPRRSRRQIGSVTVTICEPTAVQCDHPLWS